jgi:hypothetical protein
MNFSKFTLAIVFIFSLAFISCEKQHIDVTDNTEKTIKSDVDVNPKEIINALCYDVKNVDPFRICTDNYSPVCACEVITFGNACNAEANGFKNYKPGTCVDNQCKNEEVRKFFYTADLYCNPEVAVCGCDGVTYRSWCRAISSGTMVWTIGPCGNPLRDVMQYINL